MFESETGKTHAVVLTGGVVSARERLGNLECKVGGGPGVGRINLASMGNGEMNV